MSRHLTPAELAGLDNYAEHANKVAGLVGMFNRRVRSLQLVQIINAALTLVALAAVFLTLLGILNARSTVRQQQLCQLLGSLEQAPVVVQLRLELHCKDRPHPLPLPTVPVPVPPAALPAPHLTPEAPRTGPAQRTPVRPVRSATPTHLPQPVRPTSTPKPTPSRTPPIVLPTVCVGRFCV